MYFTNYSQTYESTLRSADYHEYDERNRVTERTEDIPEAILGNEQKMSYKERGGNSYVKNGSLLQSSEFTIMGQEIVNGKATTLSFKTYNGKPNLYMVTEDGEHTPLFDLSSF